MKITDTTPTPTRTFSIELDADEVKDLIYLLRSRYIKVPPGMVSRSDYIPAPDEKYAPMLERAHRGEIG